MALIVSTWTWGDRYAQHYIDRLAAGVARHLAQPYEFRVFEPDDEDRHLTEVKGCFARLRAFDPAWQARQGLTLGDRIVCLDLDLIVTGDLEPLFTKPEPFGILQGVNLHSGRFNGSVWWTTAGYRPDVWSDFSLEAAAKVPYASFPDDQAWFEAMIPDAAALGATEGVFAFLKPGWPGGTDLPSGAKIVAFPGSRDPSQFQHLGWVRKHWVA